jgi:hypothetical protein
LDLEPPLKIRVFVVVTENTSHLYKYIYPGGLFLKLFLEMVLVPSLLKKQCLCKCFLVSDILLEECSAVRAGQCTQDRSVNEEEAKT